MRFILIITGLLISNLIMGQESNITESDLIGCWAHSREENKTNSEIMIYRSCDYKEFPFSRFRHRFELNENGKCTWLNLASNDSHSMIDGTWTYDSKKQIIEIFNTKGKSINKYNLIEYKERIIRISEY